MVPYRTKWAFNCLGRIGRVQWLDFRWKMLVIQPRADGAIAKIRGVGELLQPPLLAWMIKLPVWLAAFLAAEPNGTTEQS
jgi:hypothetical protein